MPSPIRHRRGVCQRSSDCAVGILEIWGNSDNNRSSRTKRPYPTGAACRGGHSSRPHGDRKRFYDSVEKDIGGSGPFGWRMAEAIERAERFAADRKIQIVAVRAKRD